jgi:hypothetical protein
MSLSCRQQHRLRLVKAGLRRSDPLLCAMFGMFGRLYKGEGMPAWEQVPMSPDRRRMDAWGVAVLAAMAAVFSAVLTAALVAVTAMRRPRGRPSASRPHPAQYGREAGDHQGQSPRHG